MGAAKRYKAAPAHFRIGDSPASERNNWGKKEASGGPQATDLRVEHCDRHSSDFLFAAESHDRHYSLSFKVGQTPNCTDAQISMRSAVGNPRRRVTAKVMGEGI